MGNEGHELSPEKDERLQPAYILAPASYSDYEEQEGLSLADLLLLLWEKRTVIVVATIGFCLLALVATALMPKTYRATATLILTPPTFSTDLKPAPLNTETYSALVESSFIKEKVKEALVKKGISSPDKPLTGMRVEIYPSRDRVHYRPLIDLVVQANSPERAQKIADTWADVAVRETQGLATKNQAGTLAFIQNEYPSTKKRLSDLEAVLKETQDEFDRKILKRENSWDRKIADFEARWNLDSQRKRLDSLQSELTGDKQSTSVVIDSGSETGAVRKGLVAQIHDVQLNIRRTQETIKSLKQQLRSVPQFVVITKSLPDDLLLQKLGTEASTGAARRLEQLKLQSQELNPVHQRMLQRLVDAQVSYESLVPHEKNLQIHIDSLSKQIDDLNRIILEKELALAEMRRQKTADLNQLKRQRGTKVAELQRQVDSAGAMFKELSEKYEAARLAKAEEDTDIKVGVYAGKPDHPVNPGTMLVLVLAGGTGFILSTLAVILIEFTRSAAEKGSGKPSQRLPQVRGVLGSAESEPGYRKQA